MKQKIENSGKSWLWCATAAFIAGLALSTTCAFLWLGGQVGLTAHTKLFVMSFVLCVAGMIVLTSRATRFSLLQRRLRDIAAGLGDGR